jgi:hypothetical protein
MEALIGIGIDGLMSDDPGMLRKVADELGMTLWPKETVPLTEQQRFPWKFSTQRQGKQANEPELAQK